VTTSIHPAKVRAAHAALDYLQHDRAVIGIGTGSTVNCFIEQLAAHRTRIAAAVSSSESSTTQLQRIGITVVDLNTVDSLTLYIDGADEVNPQRQLIKGGGGALTREKIIAQAARQFVCIVDESKVVKRLGRFPLPVEVIPMACQSVLRQLPGKPQPRNGFITDNGNVIIDIHDLDIDDPALLEQQLNQIPGVVTVGIFAARAADVVLVANDQTMYTI
jgi:ribose 5-phosphate isomerase A